MNADRTQKAIPTIINKLHENTCPRVDAFSAGTLTSAAGMDITALSIVAATPSDPNSVVTPDNSELRSSAALRTNTLELDILFVTVFSLVPLILELKPNPIVGVNRFEATNRALWAKNLLFLIIELIDITSVCAVLQFVKDPILDPDIPAVCTGLFDTANSTDNPRPSLNRNSPLLVIKSEKPNHRLFKSLTVPVKSRDRLTSADLDNVFE
jgi:hypothetical protein